MVATSCHAVSWSLGLFVSPFVAITTNTVVNYVYLLAAVLFIFGLKMLGQVSTAQRGNLISAAGMLLAAGATLFRLHDDLLISLVWVAIALAIGSAIGAMLAIKTPMTGMPQMVGLLNGFGGLASLLVAAAEYAKTPDIDWAYAASYVPFTIGLAVLVGAVTFTGSLVAFGKLQGLSFVPDQPVQFPGQKIAIVAGLVLCLVLSFVLAADPEAWWPLLIITLVALVLGVGLVVGIGGADMPVVIALLNSYSGLAAAMAGFVLGNFVLIITGSLVGASGLILTSIMCRAMNRSLLNVLFGGMGAVSGGGKGGAGLEGKQAKSSTPEDAAVVLEAANHVMIVPGYGMAVAQAQHAVKELTDELGQRGIEVEFAIHPVAGRMPGHMNVLLAEAGVPYEQLLDLDQANAQLEQADVALVIGANDVTNPAARHDQSSPIYGMPILNVDHARHVYVIKRSLNPGFAGIQNELYFTDNCSMLFGDAKQMITKLNEELEDL